VLLHRRVLRVQRLLEREGVLEAESDPTPEALQQAALVALQRPRPLEGSASWS
jgi:hypothetical protein